MFSGLRIEALSLSTVQDKCIHPFLKRRTRKFNFRSYVLNLIKTKIVNTDVKINISFFLSMVDSPGAD